MKCTDNATIYDDIEKCRGAKSYPGIKPYVYAISKQDIVSWPAKPSAPKTLGEAAVLTGSFALAADKKFAKIGLVTDQSELKTESQGTEGSKTWKVSTTLVIPGTEEEATGFIAEANNDQLIYLVPQRNGKFRVVGCEEFDATATLSQDSGKAVTDTNATTIAVEATDTLPAPFYTGDIVTTDGTIDASTGKAKAASSSSPSTGTSTGK